MNFLEAVEEMKSGKVVKRSIWDTNIFIKMKGFIIYCPAFESIHNPDGICELSSEDKQATDWILIH